MAVKILIVEDNADISRLLEKMLIASGYKTKAAYSGTEALLYIDSKDFDLMLLDLMLPGLSGEQVLHSVRTERALNLPIIVITAKNALSDKVYLLKAGADDYITKPFEPEEVLARIEATLRRASHPAETSREMIYEEIRLNEKSRTISYQNKDLSLTNHEYNLLALLLKTPGKVYSRESLYELVWNGGYYGENNTVNVHVSNLRKKLKEAGATKEYIQTVYGIGFKLQ